jgi:hypothetical protein
MALLLLCLIDELKEELVVFPWGEIPFFKRNKH